MQRAQGFAMQGDGTVWTNGSPSTNVVQTSYPFATISVYYTGTASLAGVFADNNTPPTVMANPFTANADGYWWFYAPDGRYDVQMAAPDLAPWTISDLQIADAHFEAGGVYSWYENVQANGNSLLGANLVQTNCLELGSGSCAMYLCIGSSCELSIRDASGNVVGWITQQGNMNVIGNYFVNGQPVGSTWVSDQNANGYSLNNLNTLNAQMVKVGNSAGPDLLTLQSVFRYGFAQSILGSNVYFDGTTFVHVDPAYPGTLISFGENASGEGGAGIDYLPIGSSSILLALLNATVHNGSPFVMLSAGADTSLDSELLNQGQWYTWAPNDTQLIFRMRGSDGVFRQAVLNLS